MKHNYVFRPVGQSPIKFYQMYYYYAGGGGGGGGGMCKGKGKGRASLDITLH